VYTLAWEDGDYAGLEVKVSSIPVGELAEVLELSQSADAASALELIARLAGKLKGWNIQDDDGNPVPATLEGLKSLDLGEMGEIVAKWVAAMTKVSDELGKGSTPGETPPPAEVSLPMEVLSASPKS